MLSLTDFPSPQINIIETERRALGQVKYFHNRSHGQNLSSPLGEGMPVALRSISLKFGLHRLLIWSFKTGVFNPRSFYLNLILGRLPPFSLILLSESHQRWLMDIGQKNAPSHSLAIVRDTQNGDKSLDHP
jgi:hypothetical protein